MHYSVLKAEASELLSIKPDGVIADLTTGMGGHTAEIASRLSTGFVIACDRDRESLEIARQNTERYADRIRFHWAPFSEFPAVLKAEGIERVDGLLADLGVSFYQLTTAERGFSISADGPLDMRLDQTGGMTAADLLNHSDEKTLADLIYQFGDERRARKLARAISRARPIRSTSHLASVVERAVPRLGKLHPATKVFMALRIAVNGEFEELDGLLAMAPSVVKPGGRVVMISFHSGEDRRVKDAFRELARQGRATLLTKKPLTASERELEENPPSRSAKLRAIELLPVN